MEANKINTTYAHAHSHPNNPNQRNNPPTYSHLKRTQKTYPEYVPMSSSYHNYPTEDEEVIYNTLRYEGF